MSIKIKRFFNLKNLLEFEDNFLSDRDSPLQMRCVPLTLNIDILS